MPAVTPSYYLSLGVISIPLKAYVAARDENIGLKNLHRACAEKGQDAGLNRLYRCSVCREDVGVADIAKGYEQGKGQYVLMTADELKALEAEKSKIMEIRAFVRAAEIDPVYLGPSSHLGPADPAGLRAFLLIRKAMQDRGLAAVVAYTRAGHERVGIIRVTDEALMLHEAFFQSEVRTYAEQAKVQVKAGEFSVDELNLAGTLVEAMVAPFDLSGYKDGYLARVNSLISARNLGQAPPKLAEAAPAPTADLMAALKASLAATKSEPKPAPAPSPAPQKAGRAKKGK